MKKLFTFLVLVVVILAGSANAQQPATRTLASSTIDFTISPNPVSGNSFTLFFDFKTPLQGDVTVSITNLIGQTIYSKVLSDADVKAGNVRFSIDDLKLDKGFYMIKLSYNASSQFQKLVIR